MNEHDPSTDPPLSPAGRARRDAMLAELQGEVVSAARRRRTRRRTVGAVGGFCAISLFAVVVLWALPSRTTPQASPVARPSSPPVVPSLIEIVATDPSVLARLSVESGSIDLSRYTINDDELLAAMDAVGSPSGLARSGGRTWLVALSPPSGVHLTQ